MYCGKCGAELRDNTKFCGKCGAIIPVKPEVVYVEEKPIESIMPNGVVVALTLCVLVLSITTIICASILTNDIDEVDSLRGVNEVVDVM